MNTARIASSVALTAAMAIFLPACLLVRTTEHHIKLNKNGGGEAMMRLVDIRSDGRTDSLVARDYAVMMASIQNEGVTEFEKGGRKVTSKQFYVGGDTLSAEIVYTFPNLDQIEGLKVRKDEMFVVVTEGREVVKTNGSVRSWIKKGHRIVWPRDATRLVYVISETSLAPGVSLAPLYRQFGNNVPEGGH